MHRPLIDIIIPIQSETHKLVSCVASLEKHTTNYRLHVYEDPSLNVSEARQAAMNLSCVGDLVCFLDDDVILMQDSWLDNLYAKMLEAGATVAYGEEHWNGKHIINEYEEISQVSFGPAACMLIDKTKIPAGVDWDKYIGLRSGWLGGDFEEVDFAYQLLAKGAKLIGTNTSVFHHMDKPKMLDFMKTDRHKTCRIMHFLIKIKNDILFEPEFFRHLAYVQASSHNDLMLKPGQSLKKCFHQVLLDNNISHYPAFKNWNLV